MMSKQSESALAYWRSEKAAKRRVKTTWSQRHIERVREMRRLSYARHKEAINARHQERRQSDPTYRNRLNDIAREKYQRNQKEIRAKENKRRAANREFFREQGRRWRETHRAARLLSEIRKRCKQQGLVINLTVEWIQSRFDAGICEISGMPFDMQAKHTAKDGGNAPTIDRIAPSGPYTMENCRMILWSLNRAFGHYGEQYMLDLFRRVLEKRETSGAP